MKHGLFYLVAIIFLVFQKSKAQENIPLGVWRTHFSYGNSTAISIASGKVYSGSLNGLFYLDKELNSTHIQSKLTGFSDVAVTHLCYSKEKDLLIVTYEDCNIDVVKEGKIINLPALKSARISTGKKINHLLLDKTSLFISTSFGLAYLDLNSIEIKEIYQNIGSGGNALDIFSSTIHNDSLFVASSQGIIVAPYNPKINLQDYNNWKTISVIGLPEILPKHIVSFNNEIYVGFETQGLYTRKVDYTWEISPLEVSGNLKSLKISKERLLICHDNIILNVSNSTWDKLSNPLIVNPMEAELDDDGTLWIADSINGLLHYSSGGIEVIVPNGPSVKEVQRLTYSNEAIVGLPGGFISLGAPKGTDFGFFTFNKGVWENYYSEQTKSTLKIPPMRDFISAAFDQKQKIWYYGSFQDGLLQQNGDQSFQIFDQSNSPLRADKNSSTATRITDLKFDYDNSLWVLNYNVLPGTNSLHQKKPDGSWQSYAVNHSLGSNAVQLEHDYYGKKWLRIEPSINNGGILVVDTESNKAIQLNNKSGQGGLVDAQINDMTFDTDGSLLLATNNGISVIYDTYNVFEGSVNATRPIFSNQYLLKDSKVTSIEIDAGGRKWIGTDGGGIWLFNNDLTTLISHFTMANSPLLSDKIIDIAIHQKTGEVFFVTERGILSFRSDSNESESELLSVKVFPNPIMPGFTGVVGISGLIESTSVKITDASGRLVYKTTSNGGMASWRISGNSLRTGVYFVFSVSETGEEKLVSKFAVVE